MNKRSIGNKADSLSRRQVADLLGLHPDSVTRALADGLASAVIKWGGSGKRMAFSQALVWRWERARSCHRNGGRPCLECSIVREDAEVVALHLLEVRHGVLESCGRDCGYPGEICQPCSA